MILHHLEQELVPLRQEEWRHLLSAILDGPRAGHPLSAVLLTLLLGCGAVGTLTLPHILVANFGSGGLAL